MISRFVAFLFFFVTAVYGEPQILSLRNNLASGRPGDFIVAVQNKAYTLLHIQSKGEDSLTIEEITVPSSRISRENFSWRNWVMSGAPFHTAWMSYTVKLSTGEMRDSYALTQGNWFSVNLSDAFLPTLLNLRFVPISDKERKKVGNPMKGGGDIKKIWQPPMVVDGQQIQGVLFTAWRARWPRDRTPLSDKIIEIYLPQDNEKYPSYFPYWIQAAGAIGKADLRVIDSGSGLVSPAPPLPGKRQF